jgi:hypothetical protein
MASRAVSSMHRFRDKVPHPRPWMLWPGWNPNSDIALAYDAKITSIARWLGATRGEIERSYSIKDNSKRESHLVD